jgi:bifunctional non-homologous end joining protein LigD
MPDPAPPADAPLSRYKQKRDFGITPEPSAKVPRGSRKRSKPLSFVVQKHWARRLHYDFRLELDGVMLSWAVPRGPSYDPAEKRMAVHVEDHPVSYNSFEGTIPAKQYGAGNVIIWDRGSWEPVGDAADGLRNGKLVFKLHGQKLAGLWELVRISKPDAKQDQWMLFKKRDEWARPLAEYDVIAALPDSVVETPLGLIEEREPRGDATARPADRAARASASAEAAQIPDLSRAVAARNLPAKLAPQLATLSAAAPAGPGWLVEPKFDGYRILARVDDGRVRLFTRNGHDWTAKLKSLADAVKSLGARRSWLDGEIVILDDKGVPDFNALQNALDNSRSEAIVYFVFDAPYLDGNDLRKVPLSARRALLRRLFDARAADGREQAEGHADEQPSSRVRYSQDFDAPAAQMLEAACRMGMEGVIAKRVDAPYVSARSDTWLKLKCSLRQEFVICGFTDRTGARSEVGSILLGYHENGRLRHGGSVGTGWDSKTGRSLHQRLAALEVDEPTLDPESVKPGRWSRRAAGSERWVEPTLVAEVEFTEWTADGHVRHPIFRGLRTDKPAAHITREEALGPAGAGTDGPSTAGNRLQAPDRPGAGRAGTGSSGGGAAVRISNPERVVDPASGVRKLDLVHYYESVADWILPHLSGRPVSLVRAPEGIGGELFFQKHPETRMPGMTVLDPALWPGHGALLTVDHVEALVSAAQMNTIEFHTWNSLAANIDQPDRMIFDLDPGEGVSWTYLQEAALLMKGLLEELKLRSWLKTSGGKGLHVVVPLTPQLDYTVVKAFSQAVVQHLARTIPSRFVARSGGANRIGRIFVDYIRNGHGQTTVAAFSVRSRPGMGVSMPVAWEQLMSLKSGAQWTVRTAREYLSFQKNDPWAAYRTCEQGLEAAMSILGFEPERVQRSAHSRRSRGS